MRVLIVKMSSLGDIIQAFPVLEYIKQHYPHAQIDWVVELPFAEIVQAHPSINRVICVQTKRWRSQLFRKGIWQEISKFRAELREFDYDLILDLQGNVKSGLVTASAKSPLKVGFGYSSVPEWPNILTTHRHYNPPKGKNIREDYLFIAQSALGKFTPLEEECVQLKVNPQENAQLVPMLDLLKQISSLKVLVCLGSNWSNKQLSNETLESFLQYFSSHSRPHFFFLWGNQVEKNNVEKLAASIPQSKVIDKFSLPVLQNVMAQVDLIIAMDSLPLHLAGTTSTPTYGFFGASSAQKYQPMGKWQHSFQGNCPYGQHFEKRCSLLRSCKTGACIKQLEGEGLFNQFLRWWSSLGLPES